MYSYIKKDLINWKKNEYSDSTIQVLESTIQSDDFKNHLHDLIKNSDNTSTRNSAQQVLDYLIGFEKQLKRDIEDQTVVDCYVCGEYNHYEQTNLGESDKNGEGYEDLVCYQCLPAYDDNIDLI
jgi:hypothetical protein